MRTRRPPQPRGRPQPLHPAQPPPTPPRPGAGDVRAAGLTASARRPLSERRGGGWGSQAAISASRGEGRQGGAGVGLPRACVGRGAGGGAKHPFQQPKGEMFSKEGLACAHGSPAKPSWALRPRRGPAAGSGRPGPDERPGSLARRGDRRAAGRSLTSRKFEESSSCFPPRPQFPAHWLRPPPSLSPPPHPLQLHATAAARFLNYSEPCFRIENKHQSGLYFLGLVCLRWDDPQEVQRFSPFKSSKEPSAGQALQPPTPPDRQSFSYLIPTR